MPEMQEIHKYYPEDRGSGRGLGEGALATATGVAGAVGGYLVGRGVTGRTGGCTGGTDCTGGCGCGGNVAAARLAAIGLSADAAKDARIATLEAQLAGTKDGKDLYAQTLRDNNTLRDEFYAFVRPLADEASRNRERVAVLESQMKDAAEKAALREELLRKDVALAESRLNGKIDTVAQTADCCCKQLSTSIAGLQATMASITQTRIPTNTICPDPAAADRDRRNDAFMALVVRALDKYLGGTAATATP